MGKEEEARPAEGPAAGSAANGLQWYRRLLQAMALSRRTAGYRRLLRSSKGSSRRRRVRVLRLGGSRRPAFRLRAAAARLRLRWRWLSPLALLARLRDAYVSLMLSASTKLASSSEGLAFACAYPSGFPAVSTHHRPPASLTHIADSHDKLLLDLYMAMAQHQFLCPTLSTFSSF